MDSIADNPYETPAVPSGPEVILAEADEIKAGIRRDRRSKTAWYGLAVFSFVPAPLFMCACGSETLLETIRYNPVAFCLLALTLAGIIGGFHRGLRIAGSRRQLDELADRYESHFLPWHSACPPRGITRFTVGGDDTGTLGAP